MIDLLLQVGATKLALSMFLAVAAWLVSRRIARPELAHLAWLLVLGIMMVPAMVSLPVPGLAAGPVTGGGLAATGAADGGARGLAAWSPALLHDAKLALVVAWLLGTMAVLAWSMARTFRFHRMLTTVSTPAGPALQREASVLAGQLGLSSVPVIHTADAQISPMVWWVGAEVRVLLPSGLIETLAAPALRGILGHELAHVARRDHVVRWVEWLACAAFWWNPVAWWARRELRAVEEVACDALVLNHLSANPRGYAGSLVSVIEFLSTPPARRPPAFASAATSSSAVHLIERRLKMILTATPSSRTPRWLRRTLQAGAVLALSLGLVYCTPDRAVAPSPTAELDLAPSKEVPVVAEFEVDRQPGTTTESRMRLKLKEWSATRRVEGPPAAEGMIEEVELTPDLSAPLVKVGRPLLQKSRAVFEYRLDTSTVPESQSGAYVERQVSGYRFKTPGR